MSIIDELRHLFPETITGQPGTVDTNGTWTASGAAVIVEARYEGVVRVVRDPYGQEVATTLMAIIAGIPAFQPHTWRFTIPSRFTPNTNLVALSVARWSDAEGEEYLEVFFP